MALLSQSGGDESVDGMGMRVRDRGSGERTEGPQFFAGKGLACEGIRPGRAGLDPSTEDFEFGGGESGFAAFRRGHDPVGIAAGGELEEGAGVGFMGDDGGLAAIAAAQGGIAKVETVAGLLFFGAVAFVAVLAKDREKVASEVDRRFGEERLDDEGGEAKSRDRELPDPGSTSLRDMGNEIEDGANEVPAEMEPKGFLARQGGAEPGRWKVSTGWELEHGASPS
jgi:hypothetical protein